MAAENVGSKRSGKLITETKFSERNVGEVGRATSIALPVLCRAYTYRWFHERDNSTEHAAQEIVGHVS